MAEWNPVHKPLDFRRGLETGGKSYNPPLLPYEISLIQALDCSEKEYRQFVRYAHDAAYTRPAEYENVPEIYAAMIPAVIGVAAATKSAATVIFTNIAIGLALTAISLLLAPKAPALESPAKIRGRKLADQIGPTRFNQTTSFDNVSSLAEYGQAIPIPFGKRGTGSDGALTGGLILAPALVWSRLYSYGTYQAFEAIYVVGEYGVTTPKVSGVRLGTAALDSLNGQDYALFWSSTLGNNRPTAARLIAGTQTEDGGTNGRQIFTSPTADGEFSSGFSMAYNPQNNIAFGTSTPIHNGSAYRFNWEVVSAPYASTNPSYSNDDDDDSIKTARTETQARRRKIAGSFADVLHKYVGQPIEDLAQLGMPGVGRAYSRRMGFTKHTRGGTTTEYEDRTEITIQKDDLLVFEINGKDYEELENRSPTDPDGGGFKNTEIDLKDLKSSSESWRIRAADLLTIGSTWVIAGSVWTVTARNREIWKPGRNMQVTFKCIEVIGVNKIGIPGTRTIREPLGGYEGGEFNPRKHCGAAFYNICRYHAAHFRPVRRDAEVIEFGIQSQVWNRANGLCNFNAIPSSGANGRLHKMDKANITLTTPRMDKYFKRTSCFSLWVRPVQTYSASAPDAWVRIPRVFCVTGNSPTDQFNYLRVRPRTSGYYEYKFVPRTGSDIAINSIDTNLATRLDAINGDLIGEDYATPYGAFRLTTTGEVVTISDLTYNRELLADPSETITETPGVIRNAPTSVAFMGDPSSNNGSTQLIKHAWYSSLLGMAKDNQGKQVSADVQHYKPNGDRYITLRLTATSTNGRAGVDIGQDYVNTTGSTYYWTSISISVVSSTGTWANGDAFTIQRSTVGSVFGNAKGYTSVAWAFSVTATTTQTTPPIQTIDRSLGRVFEENSQVSDCSHYLELTKSNENQPEHQIVYVNEYTSNENLAEYYGMSTVGLSVKSNGQISSVDQMRLWVPTGINVYRLIEKDIAPSNLFADLVYYLLTSKSQGVGNVVPTELVDTDSLETTARFLRANKIFFDGVLEESESLRSLLYDTASLQLCSFTIKNGRFGMMPALPYDSNYTISTSPIAVEQIFTAGNIIENSLQVQYIDAAQRSNFRALVSYRVTVENDLPTQASALVDWADIPESSRATTQQVFDLTEFCTNRAQALLTARFLLSVRRRVTHTVSFKTVPDALGIQPGSYIRVITESTSYSATNNGGITDAGTLVSITNIADGTYDALVYNPQTGAATEQRISILNDSVTDPSLYGCLFTLLSLEPHVNVYQVEQLTLDGDGLVSITAIEVPVDSTGASIVAKDVLTEASFRVLE